MIIIPFCAVYLSHAMQGFLFLRGNTDTVKCLMNIPPVQSSQQIRQYRRRCSLKQVFCLPKLDMKGKYVLENSLLLFGICFGLSISQNTGKGITSIS